MVQACKTTKCKKHSTCASNWFIIVKGVKLVQERGLNKGKGNDVDGYILCLWSAFQDVECGPIAFIYVAIQESDLILVFQLGFLAYLHHGRTLTRPHHHPFAAYAILWTRGRTESKGVGSIWLS